MSLNDYKKRTIAHVHHLSTVKTNPEHYTDRYKDDGDLYNCLNYGSPYVSKGLRFASWLVGEVNPGGKVLCVGCGEGYEVVKYLKEGFDAYGTELHSIKVPFLKNRIIKAQCPDLPFADNTFDLLSCTEVLEHIRESLTDVFLAECMRVAKQFFFSIATEKDGHNSHINLHDISWWYKKFTDLKFKIKNIQFKPVIDVALKTNELTQGIFMRYRYPEGVTVFADKDI